MDDKKQRNIDKCQGRRESIKRATPPWLSIEHKDQIRRMYAFAKELSKATKTNYQVDHIVPLNHPLVCGLHVPWNLQILSEEDNKKKGNNIIIDPKTGLFNTEPVKGAITIEHILSNMGIRYKGKFVRGSGNPAGQMTDLEKAYINQDLPPESYDHAEFSRRLKTIDSTANDDREFVEQSISLLLRTAKSPVELYKYLKDFAPYYAPKMGSVESNETLDKTITITIVRPDES